MNALLIALLTVGPTAFEQHLLSLAPPVIVDLTVEEGQYLPDPSCGTIGGPNRYRLGCGSSLEVADLEDDSDQNFTAPDHANYTVGDNDLSVFACFRLEENQGTAYMITHYESAATAGWLLQHTGTGTGRVSFAYYDGTSSQSNVLGNANTEGDAGQYDALMCAVFTYDDSTVGVTGQANSKYGEVSNSWTRSVTTIADPAEQLVVGGRIGNSNDWDGLLVYVGFYVGLVLDALQKDFITDNFAAPKTCEEIAAFVGSDPTFCANVTCDGATPSTTVSFGPENLTAVNAPECGTWQ